MVPLGLPMVPLVLTFPPPVTLAPKVTLAVEKRSGFSGYQWYHWLPMVPLVKFPMVPLGESRTHAVWAKLPTLESQMIQYGVLNLKFIILQISADLSG